MITKSTLIVFSQNKFESSKPKLTLSFHSPGWKLTKKSRGRIFSITLVVSKAPKFSPYHISHFWSKRKRWGEELKFLLFASVNIMAENTISLYRNRKQKLVENLTEKVLMNPKSVQIFPCNVHRWNYQKLQLQETTLEKHEIWCYIQNTTPWLNEEL